MAELESIMITCNMNVHEKRDVEIYDILGDYLSMKIDEIFYGDARIAGGTTHPNIPRIIYELRGD